MTLAVEQLVITQGDFRLEADFTLAEGARAGVIGPSGGGKSTLLSVIAGFFAPRSGRVLWHGADITALPPGDRPLSILFQDNNLFPHLTAAQNVGLGLRPDLRLSRAQKAQVGRALERVGLDGFGDRRPAALSGGQQGRVALARVLLRGRPLLLLDEPFAALGPALRAGMLELVREIVAEAGLTLMMVSHDPRDLQALDGVAILVAEGRAHAPVATEALLADPPPALRAYLG